MYDFVDETFYQVPLAIQPFVVFTVLFGLWMSWNDWFSTIFDNPIAKWLGSIAAVSNQMFKVKAIDQINSLCDIVRLARRQPQPQGSPKTVNSDMNLGAKSTAATFLRLVRLTTVFFGTGGTGMGTHYRAIDHPVLHIGVISEVQ